MQLEGLSAAVYSAALHTTSSKLVASTLPDLHSTRHPFAPAVFKHAHHSDGCYAYKLHACDRSTTCQAHLTKNTASLSGPRQLRRTSTRMLHDSSRTNPLHSLSARSSFYTCNALLCDDCCSSTAVCLVTPAPFSTYFAKNACGQLGAYILHLSSCQTGVQRSQSKVTQELRQQLTGRSLTECPAVSSCLYLVIIMLMPCNVACVQSVSWTPDVAMPSCPARLYTLVGLDLDTDCIWI
jgi:hypothetical protein